MSWGGGGEESRFGFSTCNHVRGAARRLLLDKKKKKKKHFVLWGTFHCGGGLIMTSPWYIQVHGPIRPRALTSQYLRIVASDLIRSFSCEPVWPSG